LSSNEPLLRFLLAIPSLFLLLSAILSATSNRYFIYERRIDFERGFLYRKVNSAWLFEITDVRFEQSMPMLICNTAKVVLNTEKNGSAFVLGISNASRMKQLWAEIRDAALVQRRDLKTIWV
jgi:hypothetical protein